MTTVTQLAEAISLPNKDIRWDHYHTATTVTSKLTHLPSGFVIEGNTVSKHVAFTECGRVVNLLRARLALASLREPSKAMLAAVDHRCESSGENYPEPVKEDDALVVWRQMIDAVEMGE